MKEYIIALVKVFKEKTWAETFRSGQLYMNPISYFIKSDQKQVGDNSEATAIFKKYEVGFLDKQLFRYNLRVVDGVVINSPAFCMYAIYYSDYYRYGKIKLLSNEMKNFGQYAVVVTNVRAFLERIEQKERQLDYSFIKYIDFSTIDGTVFNPIVKKSKTYKHQKEFRVFSNTIVISSNYSDIEKDEFNSIKYVDSDHYDGFIDDISSITSEVLFTDELINGINLQLNIDWNFCRKTNLDLTTKKMWIKNRGSKYGCD